MNDFYERILINAIDSQVSDIHIQVKDQTLILFRKSGQLEQVETVSKRKGEKLINYIRYISKIDMNYRNKPQTGHTIFNYLQKRYNLRISSLVGKDTDTIVIRILNNHEALRIDKLTCIQKVTDFLNTIVKYDHGLFVISGATGSGKSTTLYTILDTIQQIMKKNIITLEDPVEIDKDYCLQIELNEQQGITYEQSLKQILRHDPDIIMIGEIRDDKTAKLALTCALTGHLVLTTLHAGNCINTIKRLENLGIHQLDLEDVLIGVMTQKMKFDQQGNNIIIPEFMKKKEIDAYLNKHTIHYFDFHQAMLELQKLGIYYEF